MISSADVATQVQFFRDNGYVKLGRILTDAQLEALRSAADAQRLQPSGPVTFDKRLGEPVVLRVSRVIQRNGLFLEAATLPVVVSVISQLLGAPFEVCLNRCNMLLYKPPYHEDTIEWHQDARGWQCNRLLAMMLALDDVTAANGCLHVAPRIHLHPKYKEPEAAADYSAPFYEEAIADSLPVECKAGEAFLFHSLTPHSAQANSTATSHRSLHFAYVASADRHLVQPVSSFGELESIAIEQDDAQSRPLLAE
ncbi:MAG: phytanoyl-CoA dioxygenase [Paenibacillus sp.]|nr:phytanoyl-CoA dioxygenase [Paenibacillus sp.]